VLESNPAENSGARSPIAVLPQYWSDEPSRRRYLDRLFDGTAGDYDFVERLLGFGNGVRHRRDALARAGLVSGMHVLDIATGTGLVAREAQALVGPEGRVVGLDPSAGMLAQAGQLEIPLVRALGERLPVRDGAFDFVSMGYALRHVADLGALFAEMRRVLKPGGIACVLEITRPRSRFVSVPLRVFMTGVVPVVAGVLRRNDHARDLMRFYWDTIDACVPPEKIIEAMRQAGFANVDRAVSLGMFSDYAAH
jgi:demethylmenaquinone methyltransferase/2-methoxy-6-polyprenyl-1,4-benzoquinol methylase